MPQYCMDFQKNDSEMSIICQWYVNGLGTEWGLVFQHLGGCDKAACFHPFFSLNLYSMLNFSVYTSGKSQFINLLVLERE